MSAQRQFQGLLAGHMLDLFGSVDRFTLGMAVAVALDVIHALTPGHGKAVIFSHPTRLRDDSPVSLYIRRAVARAAQAGCCEGDGPQSLASRCPRPSEEPHQWMPYSLILKSQVSHDRKNGAGEIEFVPNNHLQSLADPVCEHLCFGWCRCDRHLCRHRHLCRRSSPAEGFRSGGASSNDDRSYCFGVGVSVPPSQPPAYPITNKTTITAITPYQRRLF